MCDIWMLQWCGGGVWCYVMRNVGRGCCSLSFQYCTATKDTLQTPALALFSDTHIIRHSDAGFELQHTSRLVDIPLTAYCCIDNCMYDSFPSAVSIPASSHLQTASSLLDPAEEQTVSLLLICHVHSLYHKRNVVIEFAWRSSDSCRHFLLVASAATPCAACHILEGSDSELFQLNNPPFFRSADPGSTFSFSSPVMFHKESKDDVTSSLPMQLITAEDEMKVVASNLPERALTCLHILGVPFTIAPHLTKQPHSPGHSRVPQHLHHAHSSSNNEQKDPIQRASSPAPRSHHYGPLCSGWLSLQKTAGKWKRMWCEYAEGQITYRDDETSRKAKGQVAVTFIEAEVNPYKPQPATTPPQLPVSPTAQRQASHNAQLLAAAPTQQQLQQQQAMLNQASEVAVLPASPQLTTSVSSPLVPSSTTRAQPATPNRPTPIATQVNGTPKGNGVHSPRDDGLADTLTRLALSPPPPQLAPSNSSNASPPSPAPPTFFSTPNASLQSSTASASKFDELYYSYLDSLDHPFTFKVYAPARVYYFRADTPEMRDNFVKTIRTHLLSSSLDNNPLYTKKHLASLAIASCLHEQFMLQLDRYNQLVKALAKMTMEDELPITSTRKEKSGVLCMETMSDGVIKWRDYYFVLFEGALFYYKDSKSTTPTGFITLRYATLTIDVSAIFRADFVFHVVTPLRTIACRTKHAVALAEWISALDATLAAHSIRGRDGGDKRGGGRERIGSFGGIGMERQTSGSTGAGVVNTLTVATGLGDRERSMSDNGTLYSSGGMSFVAGGERDKARSTAVLQNISKFIADIQSFNSLIANSTGLDGFRKFLSEERDRRSMLALDFYIATNEYIALWTQIANANGSSSSSSTPPAVSAAEVVPLGESIQSRFFTTNSADTLLPYVPAVLTAAFVSPLPASTFTPALFDSLRKALSSLLTSDYLDFKRTPDYDALSAVLSNSSSSLHHSDDRHVEPFDPASLQLFLLKVKGTKKSKEIKFPKKEQLWTIGRDKSNKLVIEDSRVSRSHARVEYTDVGCEYVDLGSSCGSKLNGKPVLRARLKAGDVIELGQSTLIFQVKPKKRFRLFGGE